jgi:uncharacterized membrane protein YkoI
MKRSTLLTLALGLGIGLGILGLACHNSTAPNTSGMRAALDKSKVSLSRSAALAQANVQDGLSVKAKLMTESNPLFAVNAVGSGTMHDVRVDAVNGDVLSNTETGAGSDPCPGSIPLDQAIAIAEERIGGKAVQIGPDDDDACLREVIVLRNDDKLYEVKLARDGAVLEVELADGEDD